MQIYFWKITELIQDMRGFYKKVLTYGVNFSSFLDKSKHSEPMKRVTEDFATDFFSV